MDISVLNVEPAEANKAGDSLVGLMDSLNLDESLIDNRLAVLLSKGDLSNKQLSIIITLLQYKHLMNIQDGSDCENQKEFEFAVRNIFKIRKDNLRIDLLCQILYFTLLLNKESFQTKVEHLMQQVLNELTFDIHYACSGFSDEDKKTIEDYMEAFDVMLDACIASGCIITLRLVDSPLENILFGNIDKLNVKLLTVIFPKMIDIIQEYDILERVVELLLNRFNYSDAYTLVDVKILSSMINYVLPIKSECSHHEAKYSIVDKNAFWFFIHSHFLQNSNLKKFAIQFAKRAISSVSSFKMDINRNESEGLYRIRWIVAEEEQLLKTWENFFTIVESLDEKQYHIVSSALPLLSKLDKLQPVWFHCALSIALGHDNQSIKRKVLQFALSLKLKDNDSDVLIAKDISKALNCLTIFQDIEDKNSILTQLREFLYIENNMKIFLKAVNLGDLSPVPAFYLTYQLTELLRAKDMSKELIWQIFQWKPAFNANNVYLREASQCCLIYSLCTLTPETIDIQFAYEILKLFPTSKLFHRGSTLWNTVYDWIYNFGPEDILDFTNYIIMQKNLETTNDINHAARFFTMAMEMYVDMGPSYLVNITNMLGSMESSKNREYASRENLEFNCKFLIAFFSEFCPKYVDKVYEDNCVKIIIFKKIAPLVPALFGYLCKQIKIISQIADISIIDNYIQGVKLLLRIKIMPYHLIIEKCQNLIKISKLVLGSENGVSQKYFIAHLLASFATHFLLDDSVDGVIKTNEISLIYDAIVNFDSENSPSTRTHALQGKLIAGINAAYAEISYCYYTSIPLDCYDEKLRHILYNRALGHLECGGHDSLPWVLKLTEELFYSILNDCSELAGTFKSFLEYCWKEIIELRKSEHFKPCLQHFIRNIFQSVVLLCADFKDEVVEYANNIFSLGENSGLAPFELIKHIFKLFSNDQLSGGNLLDSQDVIVSIISKCLLYGQMLRKDQKIEMEACSFVNSNTSLFKPLDYLNYNINVDHSIRSVAIRLILENNNVITSDNVARSICKEVDEAFVSKHRYHENSHLHRILLRGLQALLCLLLINPDCEENSRTANWCIAFLTRLPHHRSIKVMFEWYIALYILVNKNGDCKILHLEEVPLISQFLIKYHVLKFKVLQYFNFASEEKGNTIDDKHISDEFHQTLEFFLANTMGQNFGIRLHAQYLSTKLMNINQGGLKRYKYIQKVINNTLGQNSSEKGLEKLKEDFYINNFDVIRNLTPEVILYHVPRLTGVAPDEIVSLSSIPSISDCYNTIVVEKSKHRKNFPVKELNLIHACVHLKQMLPDSLESCSTETMAIMNDSITEEFENLTIQKKFIPSTEIVTNGVDKSYLEGSFGFERKGASKSELIIVASLIDRVPNLGGLARTCEVFGAFKYIVADIQVIKDKHFQSLSVTAEKWLDIEEVKPGLPLKKYIMSMRQKGYSIVCAEQTTASVKLDCFKFPKKTLVLLGSEREGIPCDLFPLMDNYVEIPQMGLIRSLNVHVSASLFIWEYARQHCIP